VNPARLSTDQPILTNLLALVLVVAGAAAISGMTRETYPVVSTGWVRIQTLLPGATPDDVERLVTVPIEDAVAELDGVKRVTSFSGESFSTVRVELLAGLDDPSAVLASIATEVHGLRDLPPTAELPVVREERVRLPALKVALVGDVEPVVLQTIGRRLHRELTRIQGMGEIESIGLARRQLDVRVDPDRLRATGVSLEQVIAQIETRSRDLAAGRVDDGARQWIVRGLIRTETAQALGDIVVRPGPMGSAVRLRHVARILDTFDESAIDAFVDGQTAILFDLYRRQGSDVIDLNRRTRELVAREGRDLPDGLRLIAFDDASMEVARTTGVLYQNALFGLALIFCTLSLFMGPRNSIVAAALGIPVALGAAAVLIEAMDVSINVLSLGALILCLGLVVDDTIVFVENIYRHLESGKSRLEATLDATREVMWPVISATLTTCAAFLPMLVMTGILGEFFAIFPKVVVAVLAASLFEALFILPSHMAHFGGVPRPREDSRFSELSARVRALGATLSARYERALSACLRRDRATLGLAYLLFGGLLALALATKEVVILTEGDVNAFDVLIEMPADSSNQATETVLREVERRLERLRTPDVEAIWATRGRSRTEFRPVEEDYVAMATVTLVPQEVRSSKRAGRDLLAQASRAFDDLVGPVEVQVVENKFGPPVGAPVQVRIAGNDPLRLATLAAEVEAELRKIDGVTAVDNTLAGTKRELLVTIDEGRAALRGLTAPQIGRWLRFALSDAPVANVLVDNERVDLIARLDTRASTPEALEDLMIAYGDDTPILLGDVASVHEGRRVSQIERNDRRRGVRVSAEIDESVTAGEVNREARRRLGSLVQANSDFDFEFAGEYRETSRSIRSLFIAFGIGVLVIYSILAAQFRDLLQPLVVITTIPLSLIGVIIGFFLSGAPVGLVALIGVVGLAGIVVNDSLILVDFINQRRRGGVPTDEAIVEACKVRMRPIVATSVTTIIGILPLAVAGSEAPLMSPMAGAIAWGLTASTALTLVVVPCAYRVSTRVEAVLASLLGPLWRRMSGDHDRGSTT
jgi:multidrug efflux pump subunit AcrB